MAVAGGAVRSAGDASERGSCSRHILPPPFVNISRGGALCEAGGEEYLTGEYVASYIHYRERLRSRHDVARGGGANMAATAPRMTPGRRISILTLHHEHAIFW